MKTFKPNLPFLAVTFLLLFFITLLGKTSAETSDEKIRLSPSRLTLGALEYGAKEGKMLERNVTLTFPLSIKQPKLIELDNSQAPGVSLKSQTASGNTLRLVLQIDCLKLSEGKPFCAFIKEPLRLITNSPQEPQLIIPIIAWLSENRTQRNFNHFLYQGKHRWQGPWGTPNIAGAVLTPLLLALGGLIASLAAFLKSRKTNPPSNKSRFYHLRSILIALCLLIICSLLLWLSFLLIQTYSRGSWIAFTAGLLLMSLTKTKLRFFALTLLGLFLISVTLMPQGMNRIHSYTYVEKDKSIANRLNLWSGALQIMAEHPVKGIGTGNFETVFKRDYKKFEHRANNSTAVSDVLTYGAERGIFFTSLISGLFLVLIFIGLSSRHIIPTTLAALLGSILISSTFSSILFVRETTFFIGLSCLGLLIYLAHQFWQFNPKKIYLLKTLRLAFFCILTPLLLLSFLAFLSLQFLPTRSSTWKSSDPSFTPIGQQVEPRHSILKGTIIYLAEPEDDPDLLAQTTLRPLATLGWRVIWPGKSLDETTLLVVVNTLSYQQPQNKIFLAGHGAGARAIWLLNTHPHTPKFKSAGWGFFTSDLQDTPPPTQQTPFLVYQSLYDDRISANPALLAKDKKLFVGWPLTFILDPTPPSRSGPDWLNWINSIDRHFSTTP